MSRYVWFPIATVGNRMLPKPRRETAYWVAVLNEHDVPSGEILTLEAALKQPQIDHRNTFGRVTVDGIGEVPLFHMTAKFEKTPGTVEAPPPTLGQHTREVLAGLGYTDEEIEAFRKAGSV